MKTIVIVGTLDTKAELMLCVKDEIVHRGNRVLIVDTSTRDHSCSAADITCHQVALAAGKTFEEIRALSDRGRITELMTQGAIHQVKGLLNQNRLHGILAMGGAGAATVGTAIMRELPFGIPKLMLSSAAGMPAYAGKWFGTGDIMMMNTIVDIAGLGKLVKNVLNRAAGAICGMVDQAGVSLSELLAGSHRPLVAMTEDGASEQCAAYLRRALVEKGYDVEIFHAQGIGDQAMEKLVGEGFFDAVIDLALMGVSDELFEGNRPGGPHRLEMAGKRGIPLMMTPCGMNQTGCGPTRKNAAKYASRSKILKLDELRMGTRLNEEELLLTAKTVAEKLNRAKGPVKFFIPLRGWSGFDPPGGVLYAPEEDLIFVNELKRLLTNDRVQLMEIDANLEDPLFARSLLAEFEKVMAQRKADLPTKDEGNG